MIHKIGTVNNLHTSYKLSRGKVLTKGLTKTVSISLHQYRAYDVNETTSTGLCMLHSIENLTYILKFQYSFSEKIVTVEYLFLKTIKIRLEDGAGSIALV